MVRLLQHCLHSLAEPGEEKLDQRSPSTRSEESDKTDLGLREDETRSMARGSGHLAASLFTHAILSDPRSSNTNTRALL